MCGGDRRALSRLLNLFKAMGAHLIVALIA
jgi:3-hydroxyisobutyrate dehydrogenase-like beta-hydroxyacid dehydrogenase